MDFQEIKRFCSKLERELIALEVERNALRMLLTEQEANLKVMETDKELNKKACFFIRQIASETRLNAISSIEEILTLWAKEIYSDDYIITMEMKEVSQKESENSGLFTIQPSYQKIVNGSLMKRPIKNTSGGGLQEILSLVMRIAFGTHNGYQGAFMFDEALAAVSNDGILKYLLKFMRKFIVDLKLQCILITHSPEKFALISSKNYLIYKDNGLARAKETFLDDIKQIQDFDVDED